MVLAASFDASAVTITPNIPGINVRDYTARSMIVDPDGQIYTSVPGMPDVPDLSQPAYYREGSTFYREAIPGVKTQDFTDSSFSVDADN